MQRTKLEGKAATKIEEKAQLSLFEAGIDFCVLVLTLTAPITTAADDFHKYFFIVFRENKT